VKKLFYFFSLLLISKANAQELSINWSEISTYDHLTTGYFEGFITDKDNLIYSLWSDGSELGNFYEGLKIVGLDKNSMTITNEFIISGFGAGLGDPEQGKYYRYERLVVKEDEFIVFFRYTRDEVVTQYLQRVNMMLSPIGEPVQYFTYNKEDYKGEIDSSPELVFGNSDMSLFAVSTQLNEYGEFSKTNMKFFDFSGNLVDEQVVEVPVKFEKKKPATWFWVTLRSDDYYAIGYSVVESYLDHKGKEKEKRNSYSMIVNRNTGETQPLDYKEANARFSNVLATVDGDLLETIGVYYVKKDESGKEVAEGFFHRVLDLKTATMVTDDRVPLDADFVQQLKPANGKKPKKTDGDPLENFQIVDIKRLDDKWVMFGTSFRAWSTTTCDSRGNCRTTDYEEEKGIYVFQVDNNFSTVKSSLLHRYAIYVNKPSKEMNSFWLGNDRILIAFDVHKKTLSSFDKKTKYIPGEFRREMWTYAVYQTDGSLTYESTRLNPPKQLDEKLYKIEPNGIYQAEEGIFVISDARKALARKVFALEAPHYDRLKRKPPYEGVFSWGKIEQ
jgi:hypothetical protein